MRAANYRCTTKSRHCLVQVTQLYNCQIQNLELGHRAEHWRNRVCDIFCDCNGSLARAQIVLEAVHVGAQRGLAVHRMDEPGGLPSAILGVAASHDVARAYVHCNIESVLAAPCGLKSPSPRPSPRRTTSPQLHGFHYGPGSRLQCECR